MVREWVIVIYALTKHFPRETWKSVEFKYQDMFLNCSITIDIASGKIAWGATALTLSGGILLYIFCKFSRFS